jgi:predicted Zn-dependent protease
MQTKHFISSLACAAILGGCASAPKEAPKPPPTLLSLMTDAEQAVKTGHNEQAVAFLKAATVAFPRDKAAWLRMSQVQFDCHNYGEAISNAQQVIERDPDDIVAHSILAASGLRVASKALSDLTVKNNLTGSVRAEAHDLARLVRANIGGEIIIAPTKPKTASAELAK